MVSAKVMKAINTSIIEEKKEMLENLKSFLKDKIDGDFDQISDFIDEFSTSETVIKKSKGKKKGTRKPSYYNHWMGNALRELAKEQEHLSKEERVPKSERMGLLGKKWDEYKRSKSFEKNHSDWKIKQENDDTSSSDDSEHSVIKENDKKKAEKEKAEMEKAEKDNDDSDDSDSDEELTIIQTIDSDSDNDSD